MTREKFRLQDFEMYGEIEANNDKEVIEIMTALSKLVKTTKPEKLLAIARKINGKDGDNIIKKMQAFI